MENPSDQTDLKKPNQVVQVKKARFVLTQLQGLQGAQGWVKEGIAKSLRSTNKDRMHSVYHVCQCVSTLPEVSLGQTLGGHAQSAETARAFISRPFRNSSVRIKDRMRWQNMFLVSRPAVTVNVQRSIMGAKVLRCLWHNTVPAIHLRSECHAVPWGKLIGRLARFSRQRTMPHMSQGSFLLLY